MNTIHEILSLCWQKSMVFLVLKGTKYKEPIALF